MPVTVPPFSNYQEPMVPVHGRWNQRPKEGDQTLNVTIVWNPAVTKQAVQVNIASNSPVPLSQIVALYVDNRSCGSDVDFLFPDTGFSIQIPANEQALVPVITNAFSFYVIGLTAQVGDQTVLQVCNSMPPPIALLPSSLAVNTAVTGGNLAAALTFNLVPAGVDGTLKAIDLNGWGRGTAADQAATIVISDGGTAVLWYATIGVPNGGTLNFDYNPQINARFVNGVVFSISGAALPGAGHYSINTFFTTP